MLVLAIVLLIVLFTVVVISVTVFAFYKLRVDNPKKQQAIADLASQLRLQPSGGGRYVGRVGNYNYSIGAGVRRLNDGPGSDTYGSALKIILEMPLDQTLIGYAGCNRRPSPTETFGDAFGRSSMGMEALTARARNAMMEFVSRHGYLWVDGVPLRPENPPPNAMRLTHTGNHDSPQHVTAVLNDLVLVADAINQQDV